MQLYHTFCIISIPFLQKIRKNRGNFKKNATNKGVITQNSEKTRMSPLKNISRIALDLQPKVLYNVKKGKVIL
jgi:hypothetical protein